MRKSYSFNRCEFAYTLFRLSDREEMRLREHSLPVSVHHSLQTFHDLRRFMNFFSFNLAKIYVVLCHLFGESSHLFDDWKGTFSFPTLLRVQKSEETYFYLLSLSDWRGCFEMRLYRISEKPVPKDKSGTMHQPWPLEFPQEEIDHFFCVLHLEMIKIFRGLPQPAPFYKSVNSSLVLYGYVDEEYFEWDFESNRKYNQALKSLIKKLPAAEQQLNVKHLLQQITDTSSTEDNPY
jgi:hypothetical protein